MTVAEPAARIPAVTRHASHPLVIVGAGPAGLAAAAQAHERGITTIVLEAGPAAGAARSCGARPANCRARSPRGRRAP